MTYKKKNHVLEKVIMWELVPPRTTGSRKKLDRVALLVADPSRCNSNPFEIHDFITSYLLNHSWDFKILLAEGCPYSTESTVQKMGFYLKPFGFESVL